MTDDIKESIFGYILGLGGREEWAGLQDFEFIIVKVVNYLETRGETKVKSTSNKEIVENQLPTNYESDP